MTDPSEVVVSNVDAQRFLAELGMRWRAKNSIGVVSTKIALATLIAERVPDAIDASGKSDTMAALVAGHNACRDRVLNGK
jgi:hypothetical protein